MIKTNTFRRMTGKEIEKAFMFFIRNEDVDGLVQFVGLYPHFTDQYIKSLTARIAIVSSAISMAHTND